MQNIIINVNYKNCNEDKLHCETILFYLTKILIRTENLNKYTSLIIKNQKKF
jgi:hypothetical protein